MAAVESNIGQGTEKIYYHDAYATDFYANVVSWDTVKYKNSKLKFEINVYDVVLDKTAFFPEEGGQSPDKGILGGNIVLDVQIKKGVIHHYLIPDTPSSEPGETVYGVIDWNHRFSNMQQHSAEHLFSGTVNKEFGFNNVGFHLSDNDVTMDYDGVIPDSEVPRLERQINEVIYKNIASAATISRAEELEDVDYRSKIEIDGDIRIVEFPGYDVCACCAPHVAKTGEIGLFKIVSWQNYKGGTRFHMLAGRRAFEFLQGEHAILADIARGMTTSADKVQDRIESMKVEISSLKNKIAKAGTAMLNACIETVPNDTGNICLFTEGLEVSILRSALAKLQDDHEVTAVFDGNDNDGYRYIAASLNDASEINNRLKAEFGARGGGQRTMMQGSVNAKAEELAGLFDAAFYV